MHGQKMIDPPWQTRLPPRIFFKDSTCVWSKDVWAPWIWLTRIWLSSFLKIQHVHGQKMTDPPKVWQANISPRIFFKDSTCPWSKDDWPPLGRPGSHLEFFLKIQHMHGKKMIDPLRCAWPGSDLGFFKDSTCAWSKRWPTPQGITGQYLT